MFAMYRFVLTLNKGTDIGDALQGACDSHSWCTARRSHLDVRHRRPFSDPYEDDAGARSRWCKCSTSRLARSPGSRRARFPARAGSTVLRRLFGWDLQTRRPGTALRGHPHPRSPVQRSTALARPYFRGASALESGGHLLREPCTTSLGACYDEVAYSDHLPFSQASRALRIF